MSKNYLLSSLEEKQATRLSNSITLPLIGSSTKLIHSEYNEAVDEGLAKGDDKILISIWAI